MSLTRRQPPRWCPSSILPEIESYAREPLIKSHAVATVVFRDGVREARRSQGLFPLASRATKQAARKAPSLRVAAKCGVCGVALLGVVVLATTFVVRLASICILPATQSVEDLIRGSLMIIGQYTRRKYTVLLRVTRQGCLLLLNSRKRFRLRLEAALVENRLAAHILDALPLGMMPH
jgi:Flp pilus assembly protein TadB